MYLPLWAVVLMGICTAIVLFQLAVIFVFWILAQQNWGG